MGVWEFLFLVFVCSLLSVMLYTWISAILLSPYMLCAWVHFISCGSSLEYAYIVFSALSSLFCTMWICPLLVILFYIYNVWHVLSFRVAVSCTALYVLYYSFWVGLVLGWWIFGVITLECGCEGGFLACGVFEELQRSCWGIWGGRCSNGYCSSILCKCKNVLLCWDVTLCFAVVVFALCYGCIRGGGQCTEHNVNIF